MTTSDIINVEGTFVVKLRDLNIEIFFYTQLTLNEDDNSFEEQLNDLNYRKIVKSYMMLVGKTFISLLMMFLFLVLDAVCISILIFMLNI